MRPSLLLAALLVPAAARPGGALRSQEPRAYSFDKRTQLGDSVAGGVLEFDIEPGTINTAGNIGFGADFKIKSGDVESGGEAIFISNREGGLRLITRFDVPAPGGWANAKGFWGPVMINAAGDLAFVFLLQGAPHDQFGGLFVYSKEADETVPLILPNKPAPGGGLFKGAGAHATINNKGMVACPALIEAGFSQSIPPFRDGLGVGIFRQDSSGALKSVVRPGDPAKPDGRTFDIAINPFLNDAGDMGFDAHRTDERCEPIGGAIFCTLGVYLLK